MRPQSHHLKLNFYDVDASSGRLVIDSSGNSTFAGNVTIGTGIIKPNIGGDIAITQGAIGLRINDAASAISPTTATSNNDNAVDLGVSNIRFRNLYIGGTGTFGDYIDAGGRIKVSGGNTDQYYFEGARNGVGVTYRLYDNANNIYHDSYSSQVIRVNQIGGSGGGFFFSGGDFNLTTTNVHINGGTNYNDKSNLYLSNGRSLIQSDIVNLTANGDTSLDFQTRKNGSLASAMFINEFRNATFAGNVTISQPTNGSDAILSLISKSAAGNSRTSTIEYDADNEYMYFKNAGTTVATMTSGGNVGIGTSDVEETLTIAKTDGGDGTIVGLRSDASFSQFELVTKNSQVDWGLQTIGARNMYFTTNATERMRITGGGNVVINYNATGGVVDPLYSKFTVATQPPYNLANSQINPTTATFFSDKMTNNGYNSILQLVSVRTSLTSGQFSNGYLGFSTLDNSNGQGVIDAGRIAIVNEVGQARNSATALSFWTNTPNGNVSNTPATEKMRITSAGNVLISKTSAGSVLAKGVELRDEGNIFACTNVANTSSYFSNIATSGTRELIRFYAGTAQVGSINSNGTTTAYNTTSDYRLKEDLKDFNGLDKVSKIPVYDFKWKTDESRSYGVMAHELQEVLPDAVSGEKDGKEMQGVDYSKIVPLLVKSIQELKADSDSLKARIETLENK